MASDVNSSCYDSIAKDDIYEEYPDIIKVLLQPILLPRYINYDFFDLSMRLRDSGMIVIRIAEGTDMESIVRNLPDRLNAICARGMESLSIHLFTPRDREPVLKPSEM